MPHARSRSRRRYRKKYGRSYSGRPIGLERALQHIEEAKQLSHELGGTDKDVKNYFFSLSDRQLSKILDTYEQKYGRDARSYAASTLPKWRSGEVQMSGMVASRLFNLLPPRMPPAAKYKLTEDLWHHVGPSSRKVLRVGMDAGIDEALDAVRAHIESVVVDYKVPETLERRFDWLSAGDVHVKQDLLNHLRKMEQSLVIEGARAQLPIMLNHLKGAEGQNTHRLAQILKIGKHELEIILDKHRAGIRLEEPSSVGNVAAKPSYAWVWWLIGISLIIFYFAR